MFPDVLGSQLGLPLGVGHIQNGLRRLIHGAAALRDFVLLGHQPKFHRMDALGIPGAGAQIGVFIVVDFGQPGRHAPGKDAVGEFQNFPSGAEVLAQGDQPAPGLAGLIGRVFFQKQPGLGQPEAVDALLYVAHRLSSRQMRDKMLS